MSADARWADLLPRLLSAAGLIVVGLGAVWAGGLVFAAALWVLGGLMIWELTRMIASDAPAAAIRLGALASGVLAATWFLPAIFLIPMVLAVAVVGAGQLGRERAFFAVGAAGILLACQMAGLLRVEGGLTLFLWLIGVVVISDVAGYFAGRIIGGPKFWPRISPKKTWSGTIAGWIGASIVGLAFSGPSGFGQALVPLSVLVALAGQMGDLSESALKRRLGVKDSSGLIPGHGGELDRFDAMLAAALLGGLLHAAGLLTGTT